MHLFLDDSEGYREEVDGCDIFCELELPGELLWPIELAGDTLLAVAHGDILWPLATGDNLLPLAPGDILLPLLLLFSPFLRKVDDDEDDEDHVGTVTEVIDEDNGENEDGESLGSFRARSRDTLICSRDRLSVSTLRDPRDLSEVISFGSCFTRPRDVGPGPVGGGVSRNEGRGLGAIAYRAG